MLVLGCHDGDEFHLSGGIRIKIHYLRGEFRLIFDVPDHVRIVHDKVKNRGEPGYAAALAARIANPAPYTRKPKGEK